jgi:hypothetical protein
MTDSSKIRGRFSIFPARQPGELPRSSLPIPFSAVPAGSPGMRRQGTAVGTFPNQAAASETRLNFFKGRDSAGL